MKRRDFLLSAGAAGLGTVTLDLLAARAGESGPARREFIEWQTYTVKEPARKKALIDVLDDALIPALNGQGIETVGVFSPLGDEAKFEDNVFVALQHKTPESFLTLSSRLSADETFRKNAAPLFETTSKDPLFTALETSLLYGFETCPVLEKRELGDDRVFEFRIYRSHNIERNAAKIHMFERGGELALFRELGLHPIFFGESVFGKMLPNLSYLVGCENLETLRASWKKFGPHPTWQKIKDAPEYADTATEITRVVLKPSRKSQI